MSHSGFRLQDLLCFSVYATGHAFNRAYKPLLDAIGLTYPQYLAMVVLWEQEDQSIGQTVGQIGERLMLESSTLTPLIKRLETAGLVTRLRDSQDERVVRVRLTAAGQALQAKAASVPACILRMLDSQESELKALTAALETIRSALLRHAAHAA